MSSALIVDSWLTENTSFSGANKRSLTKTVHGLAKRIPADQKTTIGISGAPGSGKSTLARALIHYLEQTGTPACRLSLDDYYLGRAERAQLAQKQHPLFRRRGVPGTHELKRLLSDIDALRAGDIGKVHLPVFDKSTDDRAPESNWRSVPAVPKVVLLEGWCIGAPPEKPNRLERPINAMEQEHDSNAAWRLEVFRAWNEMHRSLRERLDLLWYIRAPDWDCVVGWRWQQEQELENPKLRSRQDVREFLASFERIVRHMQQSFPEWADLSIDTDRQHNFSLPDQYRN
ncbi:MAG: kinase [Gammaproteobacteria bacterium]|nr:kinase [Gammaproteobacteria bacterium]